MGAINAPGQGGGAPKKAPSLNGWRPKKGGKPAPASGSGRAAVDGRSVPAIKAPAGPRGPVSAPDGPADPVPSINGSKSDISKIQQILRNHGYNIQVDGIAGPLTKSALENWHSSSSNSKAWNKSNVAAPASGGYKGGALPATESLPGSTTPADTASTGTTTAATSPDLQSILKLMSGTQAGDINPADYLSNPVKQGQATTNAQFNPQISAANKAISDAVAQGKVNIADLSKWFGDAQGIAKAGAQQSHTMEQADQAAQGNVAQGILAAFGGNAGAGGQSLAQTGLNDSQQLASEAQNHDAFSSMLQGLISNQGASEMGQQQASDQKNIGDMRSALTALIGQKANALTANTESAKQTNLSNLIGIRGSNNATDANALNKAITMAELPQTLAGTTLKNQYTQSKIAQSQASYQSTLQRMHNAGIIDQAQYDHLLAETAKLKSSTAGSKPPKSFFANATPTDVSNAKAQILAAITAAKKTNPNFRWQDAVKVAKSTILPWNPATPGVNAVIGSGLALAGYPGYTPK